MSCRHRPKPLIGVGEFVECPLRFQLALLQQLVNFREDGFAQIGAVAAEKPAVGLVQIAFHHALADAVFAHDHKWGQIYLMRADVCRSGYPAVWLD